jgi:hypothetical protein
MEAQNPMSVVRAGKECLSKLVGEERDAEVAGKWTRFGGGRPTYQGVAANVAESYDIPPAAPYCFPVRIEFLAECNAGPRNLIRANT